MSTTKCRQDTRSIPNLRRCLGSQLTRPYETMACSAIEATGLLAYNTQ